MVEQGRIHRSGYHCYTRVNQSAEETVFLFDGDADGAGFVDGAEAEVLAAPIEPEEHGFTRGNGEEQGL